MQGPAASGNPLGRADPQRPAGEERGVAAGERNAADNQIDRGGSPGRIGQIALGTAEDHPLRGG